MIKKDQPFFFAIILVGFMDWLTTIVGVAFLGASETNPLLVSLVSSNMVLFSTVKLLAIVVTGIAFYKAIGLSTGLNWSKTKGFLHIGYSLTFLILSAVVINNLSVVLKF
jgi:hypothetical protein